MESSRPPTRLNPAEAKSLTGGEKSSRPSNHGLTVCWSEDGTSVRCFSISERTWLETISCAMRSLVDGRLRSASKLHTTITSTANDTAGIIQRQERRNGRFVTSLSSRTPARIRFRKAAGGSKRRAVLLTAECRLRSSLYV